MSGLSKTIRIALVVLIVARAFPAEDIPLPVNLQFELLRKILTFDRNLKSRVGEEIVIGIVYQKTFRQSVIVKAELEKAVRGASPITIEGLPVRLVPVDVSGGSLPEDVLVREDVKFLYITPLRAFDIRGLEQICRGKRIMSITGIPDYVDKGISVGFGLKGQRPEIIINLPSARAEGLDFTSHLLNLARIIEKTRL